MPPDFEEDATTRLSAAHRGLRVPSVELVVLEGPARGTRVPLHGGSAKVGTAPGMDLRLADPTVSRVHCELRVRGNAITLRDCGSTNGTHVEGVGLRDGDIPPGATVRVG